MHLEGSHWAYRLETASEGDPCARGNVGSGDLADQKTTASPPEHVPGRLTYPLDAAVAGDGGLGCLGADRALCHLARKGEAWRDRVGLAETRLGWLSRGASSYRRVPQAASGPWWVVGSVWGDGSAESGRCCSLKFAGWKPTSIS